MRDKIFALSCQVFTVVVSPPPLVPGTAGYNSLQSGDGLAVCSTVFNPFVLVFLMAVVQSQPKPARYHPPDTELKDLQD